MHTRTHTHATQSIKEDKQNITKTEQNSEKLLHTHTHTHTHTRTCNKINQIWGEGKDESNKIKKWTSPSVSQCVSQPNDHLHLLGSQLTGSSQTNHKRGGHSSAPHSSLLTPSTLRSLNPHTGTSPHIQGPNTCTRVWKILNIQVHSHTCDTCRVPTPADVHQKYWIYKFTHASTTHTGPLHLPVCVKNIKSTSTLPQCGTYRAPTSADAHKKYWIYKYVRDLQHIQGCVSKILNLQVHSHTHHTYRAGAVCQKYWIYKYTPTPTTHTRP